MTPRITMTDVARRAGVHCTTVSLALRNHPRLPVATRKRLRALAEEMGYRPDPVLQALNHYRGRLNPRHRIATLAYLTDLDPRCGQKPSGPHSEYFAGAESRASDVGYRIEHFWLGEPGLTPNRLSATLRTRSITGVIIASHRAELETPLKINWSKFCAVKIDFSPREPAVYNVSSDRYAAIGRSMRRVRAAGYHRIGFAMHRRWDNDAGLAWSSGFLAAQQLIPREDLVPIFLFPDSLAHSTNDQHDYLAPRDAFEKWMRRFQPEALISTADFVKPHLDAMGVAIPRDLAFVDISLRDIDHKIAGVRQNSRRIGEVAVEILTGQLQQHALGVPKLPTTTLVDGTWYEGESLPERHATVGLLDNQCAGA